MRSVLTVSLPPQVKADIEARAKKAEKTVSSYIIYTVELEKNLFPKMNWLRWRGRLKKITSQEKQKSWHR